MRHSPVVREPSSVFLGGVIGTILIAMYMPIFEIAGNVRGA